MYKKKIIIKIILNNTDSRYNTNTTNTNTTTTTTKLIHVISNNTNKYKVTVF